MKNKIFLAIFSLFLVTFSFTSCGDEELVTYQEGGVLKIADPYLQIVTPVVSFQAGTPSYNISIDLINGEKRVKTLNIYSVYTDSKTGAKSGEVLLTSIAVPAGNKVNLSQDLTYADLKKGLSVNGSALPDNQNDLAVGSGWKLRFEGDTDTGVIGMAGNINIAVLSRFAGIYKVVESQYVRIDVPRPDLAWTGQERFIGSIDDNTFAYNDYWGLFAWTGQSFRFKVDFATNQIEVPILVNGALFSGNRALSCATEPNNLSLVPCDGSNVLIPDEVNGKHVIKLTYGYFTDGSGPRMFYEVLEKVN